MMIDCNGLLDAAIAHDNKRDAVNQAPILVRTLLVHRQSASKETVLQWDDLNVRRAVTLTNELARPDPINPRKGARASRRIASLITTVAALCIVGKTRSAHS